MTEKRRFVRLNANCNVKYAPMAAMHSPFDTLTKNIGGGGLKLAAVGKFKKGEVLEVEVAVKDKPPVFAVCKVAWIEASGAPQGSLEMGVEFLNIDPEDRDMLINLSNG